MAIPVTDCWLKIISPTRRLRIESKDGNWYEVQYQTRPNENSRDWQTHASASVSNDFKKVVPSFPYKDKSFWLEYIPKNDKELSFLFKGTVVVDKTPFNSLMAERLGSLSLTRK